MADIQGIYNVGALDGTVKSDFLELGVIPDELITLTTRLNLLTSTKRLFLTM